MTAELKTCHCGNQFEATTYNRTYCSDKCRHRAEYLKRDLITLTCDRCGKQFQRNARNDKVSKGYGANYCGPCYQTVKREILAAGQIMLKRKVAIRKIGYRLNAMKIMEGIKKTGVKRFSIEYALSKLKSPPKYKNLFCKIFYGVARSQGFKPFNEQGHVFFRSLPVDKYNYL